MKRLTVLFSALVLIAFAHCKNKQKTITTPPTPPEPVTAVVPKTAGEMQMEIANTRWPGTIAEELKEGQNIYTTKCISCHKAYNISEFGEKKWLHEIDDMSPKAKLTPIEKLNLTKYVLSYRETKEKMRGN